MRLELLVSPTTSRCFRSRQPRQFQLRMAIKCQSGCGSHRLARASVLRSFRSYGLLMDRLPIRGFISLGQVRLLQSDRDSVGRRDSDSRSCHHPHRSGWVILLLVPHDRSDRSIQLLHLRVASRDDHLQPDGCRRQVRVEQRGNGQRGRAHGACRAARSSRPDRTGGPRGTGGTSWSAGPRRKCWPSGTGWDRWTAGTARTARTARPGLVAGAIITLPADAAAPPGIHAARHHRDRGQEAQWRDCINHGEGLSHGVISARGREQDDWTRGRDASPGGIEFAERPGIDPMKSSEP